VSRAVRTVEVQDMYGAPGVPPAKQLREWALGALAATSRRGELTIRIVGDDESADLNRRYRDKTGPTNVLAFPSAPMPNGLPPGVAAELLPLGDLVICAPVLEREAAEQGKALDAHWAHIVIHGALHLAGYDHETVQDARVMETRERELLAVLGFGDPYAE
jgi:probable rRNA maturation factor